MLNGKRYCLKRYIMWRATKAQNMPLAVNIGTLMKKALITVRYVVTRFSVQQQNLPAVAVGPAFTKPCALIAYVTSRIIHMACSVQRCFAAAAILTSGIYLMMVRHQPANVTA